MTMKTDGLTAQGEALPKNSQTSTKLQARTALVGLPLVFLSRTPNKGVAV